MRWEWWLSGILLLGCSHDAPRDNPLDPFLTPPVTLRVATDDSAGTAALTWTRYEGQEPFAAYVVLRHAARSTDVDTLDEILEESQGAYVDTSLAPNTAYVYRVSVLNAAGLEAPSAEVQTPPISPGTIRLLPVEVDAARGALVLRWTRHVGPGFGGYDVRRRIAGMPEDTVVAEVSGRGDTVLVDTTARADVTYAYQVIVAGLGETVESNLQVAYVRLPPVQITGADFSSATSMATVTWTPYEGPRFQAYEVHRRTADEADRVVATIADVGTTSYEDDGLLGNTRYYYSVTVLTVRGEAVVGEEAGGGFHELLDAWPLPVAEDGYVRLYAEPDGGVAALTSSSEEVQLLLLDGEGGIRGHHQYLAAEADPRSVAMGLTSEGRYLTLAGTNGRCVLRLGVDGLPVWKQQPLFVDEFADPVGDLERPEGHVELVTGPARTAYFEDIVVSSSGSPVFADDFTDGASPKWARISSFAEARDGRLTRVNVGNQTSLARVVDDAWTDLSVEIGMAVSGGVAGLELGRRSLRGSLFHLEVDDLVQMARLIWYFRDVGEDTYRVLQYEEAFAFPGGTECRLHLEVVSGRVGMWAATPAVWVEARGVTGGWGALATVGDQVLVLGDGQRTTLTSTGKQVASDILDNEIGEIRVRPGLEGGRPWLGICLPWDNHLLVGQSDVSFTGQVVWPQFETRVGSGFGPAPGELLAPLSFDFGPDGRIFVLDAGNSRIQVYDADGSYVTQWGGHGSGDGEFDFGSGWTVRDLAGSVAVDVDGNVYVADVLNGRMQKFGP